MVKSEENNLEEMQTTLSKTVHKTKYDNAKKALVKLLDRKKKEGGGRLRDTHQNTTHNKFKEALVVWIRLIPEFLPKWLPKSSSMNGVDQKEPNT